LAAKLGKSENRGGLEVFSQTNTERFSSAVNRRKPLILVAGLGNVLFQDDGVGVRVIRELQKNPIPMLVFAEVGTAVLGALHFFEWADKILAVNALQAGGKPGTIYSFEVKNGGTRPWPASLHEKALLSAFKFLSRKTPPTLNILGIEPETLAFGLELSPSVQASLSQAIHAVTEIVHTWGKQR
jgi:hydrogenase maturation protease